MSLKISNLTKNIILIFLVWRFFLLWISFFSTQFIPVWGDRFPYVAEYLTSTQMPHWVWQWGNFDGVHYLTIANKFYDANYTQVFFPVYPLMIKYIGSMLVNENNLIVAISLSNVFLLLALIIFSKLLLEYRYKKEDIYWTIFFLLLFPTSYYFGSIYTESLLLFCILLFCYLIKKEKWFFGGIIGMLSSATKLLGVSLSIIVIVDLIKKFREKSVRPAEILTLFMIPFGLFIYMYYLESRFGDFLMFWHNQPAFGAERLGTGFITPPQVIYRYLKIFTTVNPQSLTFLIALEEFLAFIGAIILLVMGYFKKINLSYLMFSLIVILIPTLTGTLSSMPRYILIAFPMYMVLGTIKNTYFKLILLCGFTALLIINSTLFLRGYWVS